MTIVSVSSTPEQCTVVKHCVRAWESRDPGRFVALPKEGTIAPYRSGLNGMPAVPRWGATSPRFGPPKKTDESGRPDCLHR